MEMQLKRRRFMEISRNAELYGQLNNQINELVAQRQRVKESLNTAWEASYWEAKAKGEIPLEEEILDLIGGNGNFNIQIDNNGLATYEESENEEIDSDTDPDNDDGNSSTN